MNFYSKKSIKVFDNLSSTLVNFIWSINEFILYALFSLFFQIILLKTYSAVINRFQQVINREVFSC